MSNISKLNPKTTALLILDLQNDVIMEGGAFAESGAPAHATSQNVVENVKRLAAAVRSAGGTVDSLDKLELFQPPLEIKLRGLGAENVIVTGAWTNMSVEMTTRQGADLGFSMVLVTDGTSTVSEEWQNAAVNYAVQNLAETGTTDEVIAAIG